MILYQNSVNIVLNKRKISSINICQSNISAERKTSGSHDTYHDSKQQRHNIIASSSPLHSLLRRQPDILRRRETRKAFEGSNKS